jgi:X-Pro dipeptidyl-peptidase
MDVMRARFLTLVATLGIAAGGLVSTGSASAADLVTEIYHVPTVDGTTIQVEVYRDAAMTNVPVILTYSPYNTLGEPNPSHDSLADHFIPLGYARASADVFGTRGSGGCWDYGGIKEQQSGVDVVKFLASQPWSNGKVAMIGGSYDGTTANMVAATGIPELKAIVPEAAINHWYAYAYGNGVRYFANSEEPSDEGFDTPLAFDYGFNRTVAPDPHDPTFLISILPYRIGNCEDESLSHTQAGYSRQPDYDQFWIDRDYKMDVSNFRAAVLLAHGWKDYNVKQEEGVSLWESIPVDNPATPAVEGVPFKIMYLTQQSHAAPNGAEWAPLLDRFFAHTLLGVDNGIDTDPLRVISRGRTLTNSGTSTNLDPVYQSTWPPPAMHDVTFHLTAGDGATGGLEPAPGPAGTISYTDDAAASEEESIAQPTGSPSWRFFQSAKLDADLRLAGSAVLDAWVRTQRPTTHLTPILVDVLPNGELQFVERGFLNLDYRNGLAQHQELAPGEWGHAKVTLLPQDFTFPKGHRVGILVQSSNTVWAVPGSAGQVDIGLGPPAARASGAQQGGSSLVLPSAPIGGEHRNIPFASFKKCKGRSLTIVGSEGKDRIKGTKGRDVISALGGNDRVRGGKGKDVICGGKGRDRLAGGRDRDVLAGQQGKDHLNGGSPGAPHGVARPGKKRGDACTGGPGKDRNRACERGKA